VVELEGVNTIFPSMSDTFNWFPQKRKFPSKYAYSNRTFTFGKQTTDNFIYKKVQWRSTHSFIFSFSCRFFFGESREGSSRRGTWNTSRSTAISDSSAGSTPRRDQTRSEM